MTWPSWPTCHEEALDQVMRQLERLRPPAPRSPAAPPTYTCGGRAPDGSVVAQWPTSCDGRRCAREKTPRPAARLAVTFCWQRPIEFGIMQALVRDGSRGLSVVAYRSAVAYRRRRLKRD